MNQLYAEILKKISSVPCRNDKNGFTDKRRLEVIDDCLNTTNNPYRIIHDGNFSRIYSKVPKEMLREEIIVISSHVDVVKSIKDEKMFSELNKETLQGMYDNAATNSACVIAMLVHNLPENVVFAFTADEETGRCNGAKEVGKFFRSRGIKIFPIALDVTYEATPTALYSIENPYLPDSFLKWYGNKLIDIDKATKFSGKFVPIKSSEICFLPKEYISQNTSWFDEASAYHREKYNSYSFCLPLKGGDMHGNEGCSMKGKVFEGYILSLVQTIYIFDKSKKYEPFIAKLQEKRKNLIDALEKEYEEYQNSWKMKGFGEYLEDEYDYMDCDEGQISIYEWMKEMENEQNIEKDGIGREYYEYLIDSARYYDIDGYDDYMAETMGYLPDKYVAVSEREEYWDYPLVAWEETHKSREEWEEKYKEMLR